MNRIIFVLVAACGGSGKKEAPPPAFENPAWAADYERRASEGCACADPACLDKVHVELAAIEAKHGGMDDAPPTVHVAHGKFDRCWRDGTRDIVRDFEATAQKMCTCTTSECLRLAKIEWAGLVDGKYRENLDADLIANPAAIAASKRATDCVAKVTMPAADAIALFEKATESMCACNDFACAQATMKMRDGALQKWLDIDGRVDMNRISDLSSRYCGCMEKAAAAEIKQLASPLTYTSIDINMKCR